MTTRRNFLELTTLTAFVGSVIPSLLDDANSSRSKGLSSRKEIQTILFQGDSITDAGRDRGDYYANSGSGMGRGYVHHIVTGLLGRFPDRGYRFYNRGMSGHKVFQLAGRWDDDCLNLSPDVASILIGVNDYWHTLGDNFDGTAAVYASDFRALVARTRQNLPDCRIMIGEPFAVKGGSAIDDRWQPFDEYRKVAAEIAGETGSVFIPYHSIFDEALKLAPVEYWCPDGVHPSLAGSYLMKEAWLAGFSQL